MNLASSEASTETENTREMTHAEENIVAAAFATLSSDDLKQPSRVLALKHDTDSLESRWI